jgi:hypothetical protein
MFKGKHYISKSNLKFTAVASYLLRKVQVIEISFMFHWLASNWVGPEMIQITVTDNCHVAVTGDPICI